MKKRVLIKIGITLLVLLAVVFITYVDAKGVINNLNPTNTTVSNKVDTIAQNVVGIIQVVGVGIAIIMIIYIAIKAILATPEGRAEYKQTAVKYVIGAVLIFASTSVLSLIIKLVQTTAGKLK